MRRKARWGSAVAFRGDNRQKLWSSPDAQVAQEDVHAMAETVLGADQGPQQRQQGLERAQGARLVPRAARFAQVAVHYEDEPRTAVPREYLHTSPQHSWTSDMSNIRPLRVALLQLKKTECCVLLPL